MTRSTRPASPPSTLGVVVVTICLLWTGVVLNSEETQPAELAGSATTVVPTGPATQLNSYTPSQQAFPSVAALPSGDFAVVWQSDGSFGDDTGGLPTGTSIQIRLTDAFGVPFGEDFQVNTWTPEDEQFPSVTALASGELLVTWWSWFVDAGDTEPTRTARARLFDSAGVPLGGEFQLETTADHHQLGPVAGAAQDGGFVVAWQSLSSSGGDDSGWSIQARRFAPGGAPLGEDFQVNSEVVGSQTGPALAMRNHDEFTVVWSSDGDLRGRSFDAEGNPSGPDFLIAEGPDSPNFALLLLDVFAEASDHNLMFYAVWPNPAEFPIDIDLRARRFTATGDPIGGEIHFEVDQPEGQDLSDVVQLINGDYLVVWTRNSLADGPHGVRAQRFDAFGVPLGPSVVISESSALQLAATVGVGDGTALAAWTYAGPPSWDILGRLLDIPADTGIFADGFETGDLSAWDGAS
ncbi:MAG: hypothetical protein AAGC60_13240 [Acidobacteriota bacterium]